MEPQVTYDKKTELWRVYWARINWYFETEKEAREMVDRIKAGEFYDRAKNLKSFAEIFARL